MAKLNLEDIIIFEDEDYLVINKPYHVSTLEDRASEINILDLARQYNSALQVCHRLDKETSGILVLAKYKQAYKHLNKLFETREVNKIYHAVIEGIKTYEYIMFSAPIKILGSGGVKIDPVSGKESHTIFNTIEVFKFHTLVECNPITGRTHQIRIHLSALETPIVGDEQYGGKPFYLSQYKRHYNIGKNEDERPLMQRVALHSFSIKFQKPNKKEIYLEADYPKDFNAMVNQMRKFSK